MIVRPRIIGLLLLWVVYAGCALPAHRSHPSFGARGKGLKTLALMPPRVEVFYLETGGVREKMDDWSAQARRNIAVALEQELSGRFALRVRALSEDSMDKEVKSTLDETHALFDAVNTSVVLHSYGITNQPESPHLFKEKVDNFDYSLGEEVRELKVGEDDVLLLAAGVDHVWSEGRRALQALGVILGIGAGMATGVVVIPVLGGGTELHLALVDANTGSILWYNRAGRQSGIDLRDRESAASLVKDLFQGFPLGEEGQ